MEPQIYRQMHAVEDRHWWFGGRRAIVRSVIEQLPLPARPRILEAGCGTGGNLPLLAACGEVTGLEYDHEAAKLARERQCGTVLQASLADRLPFREGQFDLVVLLDVLEHLDDDTTSLQTLFRHVRPGGFVVITVPAFMFLWSAHDRDHRHKRRYVARELHACVRAAGFEAAQLSYFNTFLFPVIAAVRLCERLRETHAANPDLQLPRPFVNGALRRLFGSERHLIRFVPLPIGVSLLAVGRRPLQ